MIRYNPNHFDLFCVRCGRVVCPRSSPSCFYLPIFLSSYLLFLHCAANISRAAPPDESLALPPPRPPTDNCLLPTTNALLHIYISTFFCIYPIHPSIHLLHSPCRRRPPSSPFTTPPCRPAPQSPSLSPPLPRSLPLYPLRALAPPPPPSSLHLRTRPHRVVCVRPPPRVPHPHSHHPRPPLTASHRQTILPPLTHPPPLHHQHHHHRHHLHKLMILHHPLPTLSLLLVPASPSPPLQPHSVSSYISSSSC